MDDAGPGIAEEDRERIWQPFVRLAGASAVTGSGIGLAVVRELVAGQGGRCWAEAAPRGGARFVVELPGGRRDASSEAA
jgi:signal transduction histidine kinase